MVHSASQPLNEIETSSGSLYSVNLDNFSKRFKALYLHWIENKHILWNSSDIFCIATPPPAEHICYPKSSALCIWLLGYEFPNMIMIFTKMEIHFLSSQNVASELEIVKKFSKGMGLDVVLHVREDTDDGTRLIEAIFKSVGAQYTGNKNDTPFLGYIGGEVPTLELLEPWAGKIKSASFRHSYINNGLLAIFHVKDEEELMNVRKAACLSCNVMENVVVAKLKNIVFEKREMRYTTVMDETMEAILNPGLFNASIEPENVQICYPLIFQSGGAIDLRPRAASVEGALDYDCGNKNDTTSVIICGLGARYRSYSSYIARSFFVDANAGSFHTEAYMILLKAHEATISKLRPGNIVGDAYIAAVSVVRKFAPGLIAHMTKSGGTGIGLEFAEIELKITAGNTYMVKAGMVFNVCLGFTNLECYATNDSNKNKGFSLLVADTIIVGEKNTEVVTQLFLEDEEQGVPERVRRIAELSVLPCKVKETDEYIFEPVPKLLPRSTEYLRDFLDLHNNHCLPKIERYLNIYKSLVVAANFCRLYKTFLVRNCSNLNGLHHLRKYFGCRGVARLEHSLPDKIKRELIEFAKKKNIPIETCEVDTRRHRLEQLKKDVDPIMLTELWIAPLFGDDRDNWGTLEAHTNGFRYSTSRAECVDIMYNNIKYAFFLDKETCGIILLHFHMDKPIRVGSKKTKDVQFFVEVMSSDQRLEGTNNFQNFEDKLTEVQSFVVKVMEQHSDLKFDPPYIELVFNGIPNKHKHSTFIVPTSRCLVQLIQTPFLIVPLSDIKGVKLEGSTSKQTFNMIIVVEGPKEVRINSILATSLDAIRRWLHHFGVEPEWQHIPHEEEEDKKHSPDQSEEDNDEDDWSGSSGMDEEGDDDFLARIKKTASNRFSKKIAFEGPETEVLKKLNFPASLKRAFENCV